jgi:hypothetical protein
MGREEVFEGHELLRGFAIDRKLLAEADYEPVGFKQEGRNDRAGTRRLKMTQRMYRDRSEAWIAEILSEQAGWRSW